METYTLGFILGAGLMFGFTMGFLFDLIQRKKQLAKRKREELTTEFMDKQLWQFISLDEWLSSNLH